MPLLALTTSQKGIRSQISLIEDELRFVGSDTRHGRFWQWRCFDPKVHDTDGIHLYLGSENGTLGSTYR